MTMTTVTPDNAPRDATQLMLLPRAIRYRLALVLGLVQPNSPEEQAFMVATTETHAQVLLAGLLQRDANQALTPAPQMVPNPGPQQMPPQQMQQPQQMMPQQMMMRPPQMMPAPQTMPQPVFAQPMQQQPMPMMQPAPMQPAPMQQPQRQPQATSPAPQAPGPQRQPQTGGADAGSGAMVTTLTRMHQALEAVNKELGNRASSAEVEDLRNMIVGLGRTQSLMLILLLELGEKSLELDKATLCRMIAAASDQGEPENLLSTVLGAPGKG